MSKEDLEFLEIRLLKVEKLIDLLLKKKEELDDLEIGWSLNEAIHNLKLLEEQVYEDLRYCKVPLWYGGKWEEWN